jgi:hypothetical protein
MMANKESELTTAVMQYAIRCLAEGDQLALRNMNFGPREVEALRDMNLGDMCHIDTLRVHCLKIALDREVYWPMVAHLRNRREAGELQKALIIADAAQDMMQHFFGTGSREYVRLRRMLVVETINGRPPEPTEAEIQTLWDAWKQRIEGHEGMLLRPEEYLALHEETGITLRAIWSQTRRWADYGRLPAAANGA